MKILIKIAVAALIFLAVNAYISNFYLGTTASESSMEVLDQDAYTKPISTVFIGDSHVENNVDFDLLGDETYSLSSPGQCFVQSYYRLEVFLDEAINPVDVVVASVSLHSFRESRLHSGRLTRPPWPRYIRYIEVDEVFAEAPSTLWGRARTAFMPYAGNFERIFIERERSEAREKELVQLAEQEREPRPAYTGTMRDIAISRLSSQFRYGPESISQGYVHYLGRMIEAAAAQGATVVLITTPITLEYWEEVQPYLPVDDFYRTVKALPATYLDYHDLYFNRPELFSDSDHLNRRGRALFTEHLKADLAERQIAYTLE